MKAVLGPALLSEADIYGADDLGTLLREFPEIEKAHPKLWEASAAVLTDIVAGAVKQALDRPRDVPLALAELLPTAATTEAPSSSARDVLFLAKAPNDNEFALWLAPKLEAEGYRFFADILTLEPGDR